LKLFGVQFSPAAITFSAVGPDIVLSTCSPHPRCMFLPYDEESYDTCSSIVSETRCVALAFRRVHFDYTLLPSVSHTLNFTAYERKIRSFMES
jgi:16S rRNA C967 or C1407 C5-methylase (RsmB/RsmF family)